VIATVVAATNETRTDDPVRHVAKAVSMCTGATEVHIDIEGLRAEHFAHYLDPIVVCAPDDADRVLAMVDVPVMVAGPACNSPVVAIEQLVIGVADDRPESPVVDLATEMALGCGLRCWLVDVVSGAGLQEAEHLEKMADAYTRNGCTIGWDVIRHDEPARALCEFARNLPASVVVCGATPDGHLGPVGEQIVRDAPGPVLVVRSSLQPAPASSPSLPPFPPA